MAMFGIYVRFRGCIHTYLFAAFLFKHRISTGAGFCHQFHRLQMEKTAYTEKYHDMTFEYIPEIPK